MKKVTFRPPAFVPPAAKPMAEKEMQKAVAAKPMTEKETQKVVSMTDKCNENVASLKTQLSEEQPKKLPSFKTMGKKSNEGISVGRKGNENESNQKKSYNMKPKVEKKVLPVRSLTDAEYDEIFSAAIERSFNFDDTSLPSSETTTNLSEQVPASEITGKSVQNNNGNVERKVPFSERNVQPKGAKPRSDNLSEKVIEQQKELKGKVGVDQTLTDSLRDSESIYESSDDVATTSETDSSAVETNSTDVLKKKRMKSKMSRDEKMKKLLQTVRPWGSHACKSDSQFSDDSSTVFDTSNNNSEVIDLDEYVHNEPHDILKADKISDVSKKTVVDEVEVVEIKSVSNNVLKPIENLEKKVSDVSVVDEVEVVEIKSLSKNVLKPIGNLEKKVSDVSKPVKKILVNPMKKVVQKKFKVVNKDGLDKENGNRSDVMVTNMKTKASISKNKVNSAKKLEDRVKEVNRKEQGNETETRIEVSNKIQNHESEIPLDITNSSSVSEVSTSGRKRSWSVVRKRFYHPEPTKFRSHKEYILWLMEERDVGTWILCCNPECNTWRYVKDVKDPSDVPDRWFCHMNKDLNANKCNEGPDEEIPDFDPDDDFDVLYNEFTAGSVVWARVVGFPWWPAMVDDEVDTGAFYWIDDENSKYPSYYNVTFFDDKVTRAWISTDNIQKYDRHFRYNKDFKTKVAGVEYRGRIERAMLEAEKALDMTYKDRLKCFSFVVRYTGPIRRPIEVDDDDDIVVRYKKSSIDKRRKRKQIALDKIFNGNKARNERSDSRQSSSVVYKHNNVSKNDDVMVENDSRTDNQNLIVESKLSLDKNNRDLPTTSKNTDKNDINSNVNKLVTNKSIADKEDSILKSNIIADDLNKVSSENRSSSETMSPVMENVNTVNKNQDIKVNGIVAESEVKEDLVTKNSVTGKQNDVFIGNNKIENELEKNLAIENNVSEIDDSIRSENSIMENMIEEDFVIPNSIVGNDNSLSVDNNVVENEAVENLLPDDHTVQSGSIFGTVSDDKNLIIGNDCDDDEVNLQIDCSDNTLIDGLNGLDDVLVDLDLNVNTSDVYSSDMINKLNSLVENDENIDNNSNTAENVVKFQTNPVQSSNTAENQSNNSTFCGNDDSGNSLLKSDTSSFIASETDAVVPEICDEFIRDKKQMSLSQLSEE